MYDKQAEPLKPDLMYLFMLLKQNKFKIRSTHSRNDTHMS
jgi:hypothetical protein